MHKENIMKWKKKLNIFKILWSILYKNNGNEEMKSWLKIYTNPWLKNPKEGKPMLSLTIIFGQQI